MVCIIIGLALLCLAVKGYCGKKTSCLVRDTSDAYLFNLIRMLICVLIGAALVFAEGSQEYLWVDGGMLAICALSGFANAAFLVGWLLAIRKNSMVSLDVSLTLGSIIPSVLCTLLFGEVMSVPKMIGFALIVLASVILSGQDKKVKRGGAMGIILLLFAAIGDGMSGFAQQLYRQYYTDAGTRFSGVNYPKTVFHFYTYVFAALLLLAVFITCRARARASEAKNQGTQNEKRRLSPSLLIHILIMAICLFAANYFQTVATNDYGVSSQILYPVIKGGCLITVSFTAMIFFNEKITLRSVLGSLVALAGIVSMSIL